MRKFSAGAGGPGQQMQAGNSSAGNVRQKMTPKMLPHVGQTLDLQQRTMGNEQMKNYSEMTNEELRERMMRMQMDMQNLQMAMGMQNGGKETRQALLGQRTPFSVSDGGSEQAIGNYAMRDEPSGRMVIRDGRIKHEHGEIYSRIEELSSKEGRDNRTSHWNKGARACQGVSSCGN